MDINKYITETGKRARAAARSMSRTETDAKNNALLKIAEIILARQENGTLNRGKGTFLEVPFIYWCACKEQ